MAIRGQKPMVTPERATKILRYIASGQYVDTSARASGITPNTVHDWRRRGNAEVERYGIDELEGEGQADLVVSDWLNQFPDNLEASNAMWSAERPEGFNEREWPFVIFSVLFEKARSIAELSAVANIRTIARAGNWQADAWYLERTDWRRWGRKETIAHQGSEDGPAIQIEGNYTADGLLQRIALLAESESEREG